MLVIQALHEQLRDPARVHWRSLRKPRETGVGQGHNDASCVGTGRGATDQAFIGEPRDAPGHPGAGDQGASREVGHPQLATGDCQLGEHVEVGQWETGLPDEVDLELAHERRVRLEQGAPCRETPATRKLIRDQSVENRGGVGFRKYLHAQPNRRSVFAVASIAGLGPGGTTLITELNPDIERSLTRRFATLADEGRVQRTAGALEANGITVIRATDSAEAKRIVLNLIPDGSEVHHGASKTLDDTGITDAIENSGRFEAIRPRIWSMDRRTQGDDIRRMTASPDVMLGSVHAVTESGSLIAASMGGSQLGPYTSGAGRVIFVVGTQKIVADLEEGLRRIDEYAFPLEDARAQAAYGIRSGVNKVLIINREVTPGRITVVLVDEVLGF